MRFSRTRRPDVLHRVASASRAPRPVWSWRDDGSVQVDQPEPVRRLVGDCLSPVPSAALVALGEEPREAVQRVVVDLVEGLGGVSVLAPRGHVLQLVPAAARTLPASVIPVVTPPWRSLTRDGHAQRSYLPISSAVASTWPVIAPLLRTSRALSPPCPSPSPSTAHASSRCPSARARQRRALQSWRQARRADARAPERCGRGGIRAR
jgi:hypothetical protein